jgi:hypothetical protein
VNCPLCQPIKPDLERKTGFPELGRGTGGQSEGKLTAAQMTPVLRPLGRRPLLLTHFERCFLGSPLAFLFESAAATDVLEHQKHSALSSDAQRQIAVHECFPTNKHGEEVVR